MGYPLKAIASVIDTALKTGDAKPLVDLYLSGDETEQALLLKILNASPKALRLFDLEMADRVVKGEA